MTTLRTDTGRADQKPNPVSITVDDEPVEVPDHQTTPDSILTLVGLEVATNYLVRLNGRERESYKGKGEERITLHDGEVFVTVSTEPTPTS